MIDFNYTAPELLPWRIQEVLDAPSEPHRIGGVVYVPEGGGDNSRYSELFGTPERAARTLERKFASCNGNVCIAPNVDYDALLEWLGGDA